MINLRTLQAVRDEFEKIAKEKEEREEKPTSAEQFGRGLKKMLLGGVGTVGSAIGLHAGLAGDPTAAEQSMFEKLKGTATGKIKEVEGLNNAGFDPHSGDIIYDPKFGKPGILAHELGHQAIHANPIGRIVQNDFTMGLANKGAPISAGLGLATGLAGNETLESLGRNAPLAIHAPQLLYEGGASLIGLKRMHDLGAGGDMVAKAGLKQLLPAFGTYAGNAAFNYGLADSAQGVGRGIRNVFVDDTKTASEKDSGFLDTLTKVVPGTEGMHLPGFKKLVGNAATSSTSQALGKAAPAGKKLVGRVGPSTKRMADGSYVLSGYLTKD